MKPNKFIYHAKQPTTVAQREQAFEDMTGSPYWKNDGTEPVFYFLAIAAIGSFSVNEYWDAYAHPYTRDDLRRVRRFQRLRDRFFCLNQKGKIPLTTGIPPDTDDVIQGRGDAANTLNTPAVPPVTVIF